eukprot:3833953-Pleurochrysis_carterae.AAC.1
MLKKLFIRKPKPKYGTKYLQVYAGPERAVGTYSHSIPGNKKKNKTPQGNTTTPHVRLSPPPTTGGKRTGV